MRRRTRTNAMVHLTGTPGRGDECARFSGHLVLPHLSDLEGLAAANFMGGRVELAPGLTIYAADVCKLFRCTPGGWVEIQGPCATPDVAPKRAATPPRARPSGVPLNDTFRMLRQLMGSR